MQATAEAQPNIALIKYWGKRDIERNLPAAGSLSITLDTLRTRMQVEFDESLSGDRLEVNGHSDQRMLERVSRCLDHVAGANRSRASVTSEGNFPIAAGLASSASAFAALVVAVSKAAGQMKDSLTLARLAGNASGSAARSIFGGFVELAARTDEIDVHSIAAPVDWPLEVVVAITETASKPLGSGEAMIRSAATSPFYSSWIEQQDADLASARDAVLARDFAKLAAVSEHNCLKMHSVMWGSRPPIVYWSSATLECMHTVRELQDKGHAVFFTIDAGPQLKAVCLPADAQAVSDALAGCTGVVQTMRSGLGTGARLLDIE